ncbi:amidohydrolase family protein [Marinobacter sp.]|uniref:N-acyl-D-amino-acid deacylase family protein n=1 Tax=Marinobacter sp. TaxID=50741 RepID=UPI00384D7914
MPRFDTIINNGLVFDGSPQPARVRHLALKDGRVASMADTPFADAEASETIDAAGQWVMPGFLDTHTHYDAEMLAAPALSESVRHGVTTVTFGSCSISMILADPEDCADLFTRVESVPREHVLPLLQAKKTWHRPREFVAFLRQHTLGPNVTSFLGHSELRTAVMGLGRAVSRDERPTEAEMQTMEGILEEALDEGLLGLSTMTTSWDKLDGDRYRSASLPSTYAPWSEFRRFNRILRRRGRIHQGAPNIVTKWNMFLFLSESVGLWRKPLKTTLLSLMDLKANPLLVKVVAPLTGWFNRLLKADFRWQTLPNKFEVYADGIDLVIFEEFGAGQAALHLRDEVERNELLHEESYRRWFRKDYENNWGPRVWQRDFHDALIVSCPDDSLAGKSFGEVADARGLHPVDLFLDLIVEYGTDLRWHTVIANHNPKVVEKLVQDPSVIISFADSGAHIRNMAYYNFPLRLLKLVHQARERGEPIMSMEKAVWRLTGELADWFGIEAGYIREGDRADITVIDPTRLDQPLDDYHEAPIEAFGGIPRIVNRNEGLVTAVFINGGLAFRNETFAEDLGKSTRFGTFLPATDNATDKGIKHAG